MYNHLYISRMSEQILAIMSANREFTVTELALISGFSRERIAATLKALNKRNMVYISRWDAEKTKTVKSFWRIGQGENAEPPYESITKPKKTADKPVFVPQPDIAAAWIKWDSCQMAEKFLHGQKTGEPGAKPCTSVASKIESTDKSTLSQSGCAEA